MKVLLQTSRVMIAIAFTISIAGCSKHPPPDEAVASASAGLERARPRRQRPVEFLEACDGKKIGDECTVKRGDRELKGKCFSRAAGEPDQRPYCRPEFGAQKRQ